MANCNEYQELDTNERIILVGQIVHLLQNDSESFVALSSMVRNAAQRGLFEDVRILPDHPAEAPY